MSRKLHEIGSDVDPIADHRVASGKTGSATINSTWTKVLAWIKANISGLEILTKLLAVDGSGSGLDADLLDGNHASAFQPALTNPITGTGTNNQIAYWNSTSSIGSLSTILYPSLTELSYVKGVSSAIQTQLNAKADATSLSDYLPLTGGDITGTISSDVTSDTSDPSSDIDNVIRDYNGWWSLRTGLDHTVNIDIYNSGANLTALSINQSGDIGVNVEPLEKLHVSGKGYFTNDLHSEGDIIAYSTLH